MTAFGADCASDGTEKREGGRKIYQSWVAVGGSHAGTVLGRDVEMTHGGGSALAVAYLCDHEIAFRFRGWPGREGVRRVRVFGRRQRGA